MNPSGWILTFVNATAQREVEDLPFDLRNAFQRLALSVEASGLVVLRAPNSKPMGDGLWELRFSGKTGIARSIYVTASGKRVVVLHSFVKKTQKTPASAMKIARDRRKLVI